MADDYSEFRDTDDDQELQDVVPVEPEVHISREELLARYQVCSSRFKGDDHRRFLLFRLRKWSAIVFEAST